MKILVRALFALLLLSFVQPVQSKPVSLGTATKGGGFELYGKHLAEAIRACDPDLEIRVTPTRGSRQNLKLLEDGLLDLGLVEGNAARQALDGIGRVPADLRVFSVMYPNPGAFVVRADSPYRRIEDLKGQRIAFGTQASGLRILVNDVLAGLGLDWKTDFEPVILKRAAEGPALVINSEVEALWGAGIGWPGFVKVSESEAGARFIPPTAEQVEQILAAYPHLRRMTIPADTYKDQDEAIDSVGLWSRVLVRPGLDEETVARLARALHKCEDRLAESLKQGGFTKAVNTAREIAPARLHPGVREYFKEQGLIE